MQGFGQKHGYNFFVPLRTVRPELSEPFNAMGRCAHEATFRDDVLDSPDNLVVTPRGGILLCEDDASSNDGDTHPLAPGITDVNRLIGLIMAGSAFEFAGACFSPDGRTLFVNIFGDGSPGSGMTCAIRGPWRNGAL